MTGSSITSRSLFIPTCESTAYSSKKANKSARSTRKPASKRSIIWKTNATFDASAVEHAVTAPDSNRKIIQEIAKYAYEHEKETGRFPKILIFAVNDLPHTSHADQLVRICREVFEQGDDFVQKITGNPNVDRPLQRIREFRNRPNPKVVVTVDMLSTGVDIPALEFIVFLRPVKSRILWEQMLGRGTRRCNDINKTKFVVFDCFDGTLFRYFKDASNFEIEEPRTNAAHHSRDHREHLAEHRPQLSHQDSRQATCYESTRT